MLLKGVFSRNTISVSHRVTRQRPLQIGLNSNCVGCCHTTQWCIKNCLMYIHKWPLRGVYTKHEFFGWTTQNCVVQHEIAGRQKLKSFDKICVVRPRICISCKQALKDWVSKLTAESTHPFGMHFLLSLQLNWPGRHVGSGSDVIKKYFSQIS
jgi:hypothetical protein